MKKQPLELDKYTQKYEYACAMVNDYISREALIALANKSNDVFDQGSIIQWLFTTDYSTISQPEVLAQVTEKLVKANDIKARQYQRSLTRLKGTYVDVCSALGMDFVHTLTNNIVESLTAISGQSNEVFVEFFKQWPFMILAVVGSRKYVYDLFANRHRADWNSQMQNISATTP